MREKAKLENQKKKERDKLERLVDFIVLNNIFILPKHLQ